MPKNEKSVKVHPRSGESGDVSFPAQDILGSKLPAQASLHVDIYHGEGDYMTLSVIQQGRQSNELVLEQSGLLTNGRHSVYNKKATDAICSAIERAFSDNMLTAGEALKLNELRAMGVRYLADDKLSENDVQNIVKLAKTIAPEGKSGSRSYFS